MPDLSQHGLQGHAAARTAVVWDALQAVLGEAPASVVDVGGGTGGFAVRVAQLGHRVTVIDPSLDSLAVLARRAADSTVSDLVTGHQGDLSGLLDLVAEGSADVVLCHAVLEVVDDPTAALDTLAHALRPGGVLSILVSQRHAAVVARALSGHFASATALLGEADTGAAPRRFTTDQITTMLRRTGFDVSTVHAVRVFADLVQSSSVDLEPGASQALVELERAVAERPEYFPLATQLHILASRRP